MDRLSRSLLDFARMMEVFERHKVSFVSVTQQFNTGNSMGRLMLNVLYAGKVNHKGTVYPGEHEAIVDEATWRRVQEVLTRNGRIGGREVRNKYGVILKGFLFCTPCGRGMGHTYTMKKGRACYRYYVCLNAQEHGAAACPSGRLPAGEIESAVLERIKGIGRDEGLISEILLHVQEESERVSRGLRAERRTLERDLLRMNGELRKVVGVGVDGVSGGGLVTDRLADLQDRIRSLATRLDAIREELGGRGSLAPR